MKLLQDANPQAAAVDGNDNVFVVAQVIANETGIEDFEFPSVVAIHVIAGAETGPIGVFPTPAVTKAASRNCLRRTFRAHRYRSA